MHLTIKVRWKLTNISDAYQFATLSAFVTFIEGCAPKVDLVNIIIDEDALRHATKGGAVHDHALSSFRNGIRQAVRAFALDASADRSKYPVRWNEETCFECTFTEIASGPVRKTSLELSDERIETARAKLRNSERGRAVLRDLRALLGGAASGLDSVNMGAMVVLLTEFSQGRRDFVDTL
jgi:hypothetical protein